MSGWVLWVIAAAVFGIGEMLTTRFLLAPFALGAGVAALVDAAGGGGSPAWVAFVVVTLLTLGFVRPIARSQGRRPSQIRTGTAALIGKQAIVLERIVNDEGVGCVKIDGEVWTARAFDGDEIIDRGTRVHIIDVKGATALVSE